MMSFVRILLVCLVLITPTCRKKNGLSAFAPDPADGDASAPDDLFR